MKIWMDKSIANVPPKMALGKALYYLHEQWPRLIRYLDDGRYPIDNNLAENAIRPFTLGRKNWLFSNSQSGAKASANLYSLTETAKANGINPYDYMNTPPAKSGWFQVTAESRLFRLKASQSTLKSSSGSLGF